MKDTIEGLKNKLREACSMPAQRIFIADDKGDREEISNAESMPAPRINIMLQGYMILSMHEAGQVRQHELRTGDIYFINTFAPVKLHEVIGSALSLVLYKSFLRIVYVERNGDEIFSLKYYHIYDSLGISTVYAFKTLCEFCEAETVPSSDIAGRLIRIIMEFSEIDLLRSHSDTFSRSQALWLQLANHIEENYLGELSREKIAAKFKINPEYISKLFRRYSNCTYKEYILRRRLEHAAQMLKSGKYSVDETAWQCGFNSSAYFIKIFRSHHGTTPGCFQTLISKKRPRSTSV